jgi:UDP-4-amino-4,6-dideoxy-N-acetyl-beta-L-altrosamine N-acetyltransferase
MELAKILKKINFKNINLGTKQELLSILQIRNEEKIRNNMFNNDLIEVDDHLNWFNKIKDSQQNFFYIIEYSNKIIGGLSLINIHKEKNSAEWAFYISQNINLVGLGALIEYKAIDYFFQNFDLFCLNCYVMKHNHSVIKLHKKFGFKTVAIQEKFYTNIRQKESIFFSLKLSEWIKVKKKFEDNFLKI